MSKRTLSQIPNMEDSHIYTKRRLEMNTISESRFESISHSTLAFPKRDQPATKQTPFQQPTQLMSFSYDHDHNLQWTDSALRYFVDPPLGAKLEYAYDRWIKRPESRPRIDSLLQAVLRLIKNPQLNLPDIGVVCWRGVMTRILTAPYDTFDSWEMNVMCVNGTMFFEEHTSDAKLKQKEEMEPHHRRQTYYGYAFESYCTIEDPNVRSIRDDTEPPGWGGDVNTNVQWCSVVRTKLGGVRLIIGGEVDCVRDNYTRQPDTFVELKTSLTIRNSADEVKFEKKLLKFYFQSFLLGVPEIVVGFRTPSGVLTTTQSFKTIQIPRMVRGKPGAWDPSICLGWGSQFLTFLKEEIEKKAPDQDRTVWRVKFTPNHGISVTVLDPSENEDVTCGEDRVGFLPRSFWEEIHIAEQDTQSQPSSVPTATSKATIAGWQL